MTTYDTVLVAATALTIEDRLRLIDALSSDLPDDYPTTLSEEWLQEIDRRVQEVDAGTAKTESWEVIRERSRKRMEG